MTLAPHQLAPGDLAKSRGAYAERELDKAGDDKADTYIGHGFKEAKDKMAAYDAARDFLRRKDQEAVQAGKLGVDLSLQTANLRNQSRLDPTALKNVYGRNLWKSAASGSTRVSTPRCRR